MFKVKVKQMLNKLPRKTSKSTENRDHGTNLAVSSKSTSIEAANKLGKSNIVPIKASDSKIQQVSVSIPNGNLSFSTFEPLPQFKDVPNSEKPNLFIKKLELSCVIFDFNDPTKNLKEKEIKRQTLLELVDYISSPNAKFTENAIQEVIKMVSSNIFRALIPQPRQNKVNIEGVDLEDEEPSMDPTWPHLQLVYEAFLRFIASQETEVKLAKKYIDQRFILKILDLFDSEDPREREYLKTILHRIYGKFMVHRPFIRKSINNIFYQFVFETEKHNGISEFLEILGSIINGFALPLKDEHKVFLVRVLIPLHRPRCLAMYHQPLSYCISQFVEKDCKLADSVIRGILKYWPVSNSSKEVMLLNELEEILEATQPQEFNRCVVPLFRRIALCLNSLHFQVAERTLFLWNNDSIEKLIVQNHRVILPIILPALEKNAGTHWNQAVRSLTLNVRKIFEDLDPDFFNECLLEFQRKEKSEIEAQAKHTATWKRLEEVADCKRALNEKPTLNSRKSLPFGLSG